MSALLRQYIPDNFAWEQWRGEFEEIVPYLENGFAKAIIEFESNISRPDLKAELKQIVEYLCNPFPEKRGHPKNVAMRGSNYSMDRFVTILDVLRRKAEIRVKQF